MTGPIPEVDSREISHAAELLVEALAIAPAVWPGTRFPGSGDPACAADPATLHVAMQVAAARTSAHLLVFGGGAGAWELGALAAESDGATVCSIVDHDPDALRTANLPDPFPRPPKEPFPLTRSRWCAISPAPLVLRQFDRHIVPVYRHAEIILARDVPANVIVAYGPPPGLGGRHGILLQALTFAQPGSIVLLPGLSEVEQAAIADLLAVLPGLAGLVDYSSTGIRRLAAITFRALDPGALQLPSPTAPENG